MVDDNHNELAFLDYRYETIPTDFGVIQSGLLLNIKLDNVDEVHELLKKDLGDKIRSTMKSEDFGQRHFIIEGPSKIIIDVIQVFPPPVDYEENDE